MPGYTGFVDDSGGNAHDALLALIKSLAEANGWQTMDYQPSGSARRLFLKGSGLSGTEEIFVCFACSENISEDRYFMAVATATGFLPGTPATIGTQPGVSPTLYVPAHKQRIDYWLNINAQRIAGALKVGTPVYESFYVGKFFPFALPNQYPQPLIAAGMATTDVRYSDTTHSMPYKGNRANMRMRFNDGTWQQPHALPYSNTTLGASIRPAGSIYALNPVVLHNGQTSLGACNIFGVLDGIHYITGFGNATENTLSIDGKNYVVIQDVWRTGFGDYYALEI